ncbi:MAG: hypothetical protein ABIA47_03130 [bacterium]
MPRQLQIPFEPNITRRNHRRVIWLWIAVFCGLLALSAVYRVWITRDTTSVWRPEGTTMTVRVINSPRTVNILYDRLGSEALIPGGPWTFKDALMWSDREFALHYGKNGFLAAVFDNELSEEVSQIAPQFGFLIENRQGKAMILQPDTASATKPQTKFSPAGIRPYYVGDLIFWQEDGGKRFTLTVSQKSIKIHKIGLPSRRINNIALSENTKILAVFALEGDGQSAAEIIPTLHEFGTSQELINALNMSPSVIIVGEDDRGPVISINIDTDQLDFEELAMIAEDIINRRSLSTLVWTIEDGTTVEEIRADSETIVSDIRAEADYSIISVTNQNGDIIRITRTKDKVTISNRDIALELAELSIKSSCNSRSTTWMNTEVLPQSIDPASLSNLIGAFKEISVSSGSIRLCWQ